MIARTCQSLINLQNQIKQETLNPSFKTALSNFQALCGCVVTINEQLWVESAEIIEHDIVVVVEEDIVVVGCFYFTDCLEFV